MKIAFICSNNHYVNYHEHGLKDIGRCPFCRESKRTEPKFQVSTPDTEPRFNYGLGCMTKGTKDAERVARGRGLTPMGNEVLDTHKVTREQKEVSDAEYEAIIAEGVGALKANKTLDGKPIGSVMSPVEKKLHKKATGETL